jgi:hypothetical protein
MQSMLEQAVSSVNSHITKVAEDVDDIVWSLMLFDSQSIDYLYEAKASAKVTPLDASNFRPRASTPLYDAIGHALNDLDKFIDSLVDAAKPERVSIVIMTDGLENSSIEYRLPDIQASLKEREDRGWQVIYLGANQDAFGVGRQMGVNSTVTYDRNTVGVAMAAATVSSREYYRTGESPAWHIDTTETKDEDELEAQKS